MRSRKKAFTLIELTLYLGLMTSVLLLLLRFEVLGRKVSSLQITRLELLRTAHFTFEELTRKIRQADKVEVLTPETCQIQQEGKRLTFHWDREKKVLYETEVSGGKKISLILGEQIGEISFRKSPSLSSPSVEVKVKFVPTRGDVSYTRTLKRTICLFQKEF